MGLFIGDASCPAIEIVNHTENIAVTDAYGHSLLDAILLGQDCLFSGAMAEYPKAISPFWPWGTLGLAGVIGRLYYSLAEALVMSAIAGTPASSSPATLTAPKAILSPSTNLKILFGPTHRTVAVRLQLLPSLIDAELGWFSTT